MAYRVYYRFTEDGEQWHEKSPDVNGVYKDGHYRTMEIQEAMELMERTQKRLWRGYPDEDFEIKVIDAETLETKFSVGTATMDLKDWLK